MTESQLELLAMRDEFIKYIDNSLTGRSFKKDESLEKWVLERDMTKGGGQMSINGKVVNVPGETVHVTIISEVVGDGSMKDVATNIETPFIEVEFTAIENGISNDIGPTFCLYYDDNLFFEHLINQII